jgi:hypothetical protein
MRREDTMNKAVDDRWKKFEEIGERAVRQNLAANNYSEENTKQAEAWLEQKAHDRSSEEAAQAAGFHSAQTRAAIDAAAEASRSADAAERQATAAETATRVAFLALFIAALSFIVSVYQYFHGLK